MYFIYDFLILNDGILILWMYKGLSKVNKGKKRKSNEGGGYKKKLLKGIKRPSDMSGDGLATLQGVSQ